MTAGQLVYLDAGFLKLTDCNLSAAAAKVTGVAINSGGAGQHINYVTKDPSLAIGATVAIGTVYISSSTAGGIAPSADATTGHFVTVVGVGVSTTRINFDPGLAAEVDGTLVARV